MRSRSAGVLVVFCQPNSELNQCFIQPSLKVIQHQRPGSASDLLRASIHHVAGIIGLNSGRSEFCFLLNFVCTMLYGGPCSTIPKYVCSVEVADKSLRRTLTQVRAPVVLSSLFVSGNYRLWGRDFVCSSEPCAVHGKSIQTKFKP